MLSHLVEFGEYQRDRGLEVPPKDHHVATVYTASTPFTEEFLEQ